MKAITLYRADTIQWKPILVNCPNGGWPAKDADGYYIRTATHFETEAEAWRQLDQRLNEQWQTTRCEVEAMEQQLQARRQQIAELAAAMVVFERNKACRVDILA